MSRRVLVVVTSNIGADEINASIAGRFDEQTEVRVLAPASGLSRLDWLTNAEDDARIDAVHRAEEVADALDTETVEASVGDTDPLLAIDDALRTFAPDEIVVVSREEDEASWLESGTAEAARQRFDIPLTHLVVG